MSAFDANLNVVGINIPELVEEGQQDLEVTLIVGMILPFSAGPGQPPIPAPIGQLRFRLNRDAAENIAKALAERAEELPKQSDIAIANNMSAVEQAAKLDQQFKGQR